MTYKATDDDLPDIFTNAPSGGGLSVQETTPRTSEVERIPRLMWEHPGLVAWRQPEKRHRTTTKASLEAELRESTGKKQYVKLNKKRQMACWLEQLSMEEYRGKLNAWERNFVLESSLRKRFDKYAPEFVKWVTLKQYYALRAIALRVLAGQSESFTLE
jgi:hypothetical protein